MKKMSPKKKVKRIIHTVMILLSVVLFVLAIYIRREYDIPMIIAVACIIPIYIGCINLFSKWLEKSKWKDVVEEMEKEAEKEEAEERNKEKPHIFGIALIAIICLGFSIYKVITISKDIASNYAKGLCLKEIIPDYINILTLLICSTLIGIIVYNVKKRKLFTQTNAGLIHGVGATIIFSVLIQNHYWETTPMLPNDIAGSYYLLFGTFIIFFGQLFAIGVKMKEEQDLTI